MKKTGSTNKGVAYYKKQADKYFSLYVRYRDSKKINGEYLAQCITCDKWRPVKEMQNGHFVKRTVNTLRFNEQNCNAQCYSCNVMRYGEQYLYAKALDNKYGNGTADALQAQRFTTHKFSVLELQNIINESREYLKEMEVL